MNIALLLTGFRIKGKEATGITSMNFAKELARFGNNVTIIAEKREEPKKEEEIDRIQFYGIGRFKYANIYNQTLGYAFGVRRVQKNKKIRFNIIHNFSASPLFITRGFFSKLFAREAVLVHTIKSYSRSKFGRSFYFILNLADAVTVPTKIFAQKLIKAGVKEDKIQVIHSNINISKFVPLDKNKLKKEYGYTNKKVVFYYGAMWDVKGCNYLVDAIPKVINKDKNVKFVFAPRNADKYIIPYQTKIAKFWLNKYVEFIFKNIDIVDYVNLADIIVLPYPNLVGTEGNPSCLLEAMACKTPVVTTDLPELREIVEPDKDVLMAKPCDAESLAREINRLLSDRKLQKRLAENAYKKSKQFDVRKVTKQFIKLYTKLKH